MRGKDGEYTVAVGTPSLAYSDLIQIIIQPWKRHSIDQRI